MRRAYYNFENRMEYPAGLYLNTGWNSASEVLKMGEAAYVPFSKKPKERFEYYVREDLLYIWTVYYHFLYWNDEKLSDWAAINKEWFHRLFVNIPYNLEHYKTMSKLENYEPIVECKRKHWEGEEFYAYVKLSSFLKFLKDEKKFNEEIFKGTIMDPDICTFADWTDEFPKGYVMMLHMISKLEYNWDGYKAPPVPKEVIKTTSRLLETWIKYSNEVEELHVPDPTDITPAPDESIDIEVNFTSDAENSLHIWIGNNKYGFFTDYEHGINYELDVEETDFSTMPEKLLKHLKLKDNFYLNGEQKEENQSED